MRDTLFKAFAGAGFARLKDQDENKLLPCPTGTFVNSSASDPSKLKCLECPAGSDNDLTIQSKSPVVQASITFSNCFFLFCFLFAF